MARAGRASGRPRGTAGWACLRVHPWFHSCFDQEADPGAGGRRAEPCSPTCAGREVASRLPALVLPLEVCVASVGHPGVSYND
jgi:hypothetical protein